MAGRTAYYRDLKALARTKRREYAVATDNFGLREIRAIYKAEGIKIDLWRPKLRKVRAAYFDLDGEPHVLLNAAMKPIEPKLFSLAHELKHHYVDRERAQNFPLGCQDIYKGAPVIEIGAEVFAAEFIFPEEEFLEWVHSSLPSGVSSAEDVVHLKRYCPAKVSYTFLRKRLTRFGLASAKIFEGVKFKNLEERMFGVPFYRRRRR